MTSQSAKSTSTHHSGVEYDLYEVTEPRGSLAFGEFTRQIPFVAKRFFLVSNVPVGLTRGQHAHKECHQFLICIAGAIRVQLHTGLTQQTILLNSKSKGLHIPPGVWGNQIYLDPDSTLLVFTSHFYDRADYISDFEEFLRLYGPPLSDVQKVL